jgi:hypothetical protein
LSSSSSFFRSSEGSLRISSICGRRDSSLSHHFRSELLATSPNLTQLEQIADSINRNSSIALVRRSSFFVFDCSGHFGNLFIIHA